ncbi:MAG TPA: hypothetical protein VEP70_07140 [Burkholderiales bacterium]|nr:hypothetical protein [Burkholderiales bacterium]
MSSGLWIIVLEAALALGLVAFLVWWTLPRRRESEDREPKNSSSRSERP